MKTQICTHPIFQQTAIGKYVLSNRAVVAPMSRVSASPDGVPTPDMTEYYSAFAKGGFGMIITEGNYTDDAKSKAYANQPGLVNENHIQGWKKVVASSRQFNAVFIAQLMHAGALSQFLTDTIAPSCVQPVGLKMANYGGYGPFEIPREIDTKGIDIIKAGFINAALGALKAGFNGVEIHAANGYLLDQFLTPHLNIRVDGYGGNIQNRFRIIAEIFSGIRAVAPRGFLVGLRLSEGKVNDLSYRWQDGRHTAIEVLNEVAKLSVDFVHIAVQSGEWERDSCYSDGSSFSSLARQITGKPVMANGGLHDLHKARTVIEDGHADLIAIGKAALADPAWPLKILHHKSADAFHKDMLWPEATLSHTKKVLRSLSM